jgi:hypothetical protein
MAKLGDERIFQLIDREESLLTELQEKYPEQDYMRQAKEFLEHIAYSRIQLRAAL